MSDLVAVRKGIYHDSVSLMRVSKALSELPGVDVAIVAMATTLNVDLARELGFAVPDCEPADLLVAVRADDPAGAALELDRLLEALSRPSAGRTADLPPRTTRSAALAAAHAAHAAHATAPAAQGAGHGAQGAGPAAQGAGTGSGPAEGGGLVLVSVPGEHAFAEALDALEAGLNVMIFSDGVSVEQELMLKRLADARELLVMGPDCGTAVIAGAGLGFANVLKPGPVGVVAASGTGAQQVTCLLDRAGIGITHVLGVGGRDLTAEVGGLATIRALRLLDADPATELIVLVSKPPDPDVARSVQGVVESLATPVVQAFLGLTDLTSATAEALRALGSAVPEWPSWRPEPATREGSGGGLVGLYSGGTLCEEARLIAGQGDFTDFGDDAYTRGRAHPMIDPALRLEALAKVREGDTVLLDVVLGHGADPDPAASLAPAIAVCRAEAVVVSLVGTEGDPQDLARQATALTAAGAWVFTSNAEAARFAGGRHR